MPAGAAIRHIHDCLSDRLLGRLLLSELSVAVHEAGIVVTFFLPKGAYATTVLREVMKTDIAGYAVLDETDED